MKLHKIMKLLGNIFLDTDENLPGLLELPRL